MFPVLKASDFKHFANGVQGPGFLLHSLVCTMLGSHQLPGSRCTIALLRQGMGGELSGGLLSWCASLRTLPCSEAADVWAEVNTVDLPGACR